MIDFTRTFLGLTLLYPRIFKDKRGAFFESWNKQKYEEVLPYKFVQNNISISNKNTLRGLHFQKNGAAQSKLITVLSGEIFDVAVNIDPDSEFFGHWEGNVLDRNTQLFIPKNFAHGFLALTDSVVEYKCTNYYNKESERTIFYGDKDLNIKWPIKNIKDLIISEKDKRGIPFKNL